MKRKTKKMKTTRAIYIGTREATNDQIGFGHTGDVNTNELNSVSGVETVMFQPDGIKKRLPIEKNHLHIESV